MEDITSAAREALFPSELTPQWVEQVGGCMMGLAIDDGCLVPLVQDTVGYWNPTTHIPPELGARIGEIVDTGVLSSSRYRPGGRTR